MMAILETDMTNVDRLTADPPPDQPHEIGHEEGETCGRYSEEDEDQPRGYRPKPCDGVMQGISDEWLRCDQCDAGWRLT
jgi:hypothetical protein